MIGYPFDSHVEYDEHDIPIFDRAISSKPLKNLIAKLFSSGVLPNPSTNLQVGSGGDGMTVIVKAGFCIINGGLKLEDEDKTLVVQASDTTHPRIDTVVMRWNDNDEVRTCDLYIVEGTPSASPTRPALTRTESIYEIGLADIFITANSTSIDSFRITDTRMDNARCGYISSISEFDTTTLYAQIQADLDNFQEVEQADFLAWYESMRDQLSEDAAGNLQLQIDNVNGRYDGLTEDINAFRVVNQLPEVGAAGTLYLVTGEEETHFAGNVDDNKRIINDNVITTDSAFSSLHTSDLLNRKVDMEDGKGLSKNDFTDALKTKLDGLPSSFKTINGMSIAGEGNISITGGGESTELPPYYVEEFNTAKSAVESHSTPDSFNIMWMTDLHFAPKNSGYFESTLREPLFRTMKASKKFVAEVPTAVFGLGGDYMQMPNPDTKQMGIDNLTDLNEMFDSVNLPFFPIVGNHEAIFRGNSSGVGRLSDEELYQYLMKKWVGRNGIKKVSIHTFYYLDDVNGVCHVFEATVRPADTETYLKRDFPTIVAANTNDYPYIIYNHFSHESRSTGVFTPIKNCIDYIKNNLEKTIIAWVAGHAHGDWVEVYNNTLVLTLINSGYHSDVVGEDGVTYTKTAGTATESAFSVLTFVPTSGKVFITRFGAGIDWECNYNNTSGAIGRVGEQVNVTYVLSGGVATSNTNPTTDANASYTATLSVPDEHYTIDSVTVMLGSTDVTATAYDSTTHVISIASATDDITIIATATNDYMWTVEGATFSQYNASPSHQGEWEIDGNDINIILDSSNEGFKARMNLKHAITGNHSVTLKADSVSYSAGGDNLAQCTIEFYDVDDNKLKGYTFVSATSTATWEDIATGVNAWTKATDIGDATYCMLILRTRDVSSEYFTVPVEISFTNLHVEYPWD